MPEADQHNKTASANIPAQAAPDQAELNNLITPETRRSRKRLFDPSLQKEHSLSRSKIELFKDCARCFYLDVRQGISRVPSYPLSINNEIDRLLKEEFNRYRELGQPHPYMVRAGIYAVPFNHPNVAAWQDALHRGIGYRVPETNLYVRGGIDDVWEKRGVNQGQLIIVDYKATSKAGDVSLDDKWKDSYKRQTEIYQWLFRMNGFDVSDEAIFLFCNARKDTDVFDSKLDFEVTLLPYKGDAGWVEGAIREAFEVLRADAPPEPSACCEWCAYVQKAGRV